MPLLLLFDLRGFGLEALRPGSEGRGPVAALTLVLALPLALAFGGLVRRRREHFASLSIEKSVTARWASDVATVGGAGLAPIAPGTFGAIAALPFARLVAGSVLWVHVAILVSASLLALLATRVYLAHRPGSSDPGEVVVDELVGILVATAFVPWELPWVALAFFLFRVFDIRKPGPIGYVERRFKGALGVLFDDVAAGLFAGAILAAARLFFPGPML